MSVIVVPLHMSSIPTRNFIYIVYHAEVRDALVVDPVGDLELIRLELEKRRLTLRGILVTHTHYDHIGLVKPLAERHLCPVWVSQVEAAHVKVSAEFLRVIDDERLFHVGALAVEPLLTPGHTLGSICYGIGENLFTGDTLFIEGCGACSGENSDPGLLFDSLNKIKDNIADATRIYPGHRYVHPIGTSLEYVISNNIYMQFSGEDRQLFIAFRMRGAQKNLLNFS